MRKILCFFGFHDWNSSKNYRECKCCGRKEERFVDVEYQIEFWEPLK